MSVNKPQTFKPQRRRAESFQTGDQYAFVVADYRGDDFSFAADEQADLPVNIAGKKG